MLQIICIIRLLFQRNIEAELMENLEYNFSVAMGATVTWHTILESIWYAEQMCESGFFLGG